jgi:glycosyltransferase involved in cell wall biosynthesis
LEKEIAIIHTDLTLKGGGERVCISLIEALNKHGLVPSLFTFYPMGSEDFIKQYSKQVKFYPRKIYPCELRKFETYKVNLAGFISPILAHYDAVINTGAFIPYVFKTMMRRLLVYVYNPAPLFHFAPKYQRSIAWRLYYFPQHMLLRDGIARLNSNELLSVSDFTKWRIKRRWGKESCTVYPPVDLERFNKSQEKPRDGVISIGRFSPEKNHPDQLKMAQQMPTMTFRICGSANAPHLQHYFSEIKAKSEEMDLKNIEFYPNLPFEKLLDLLSRSKYFLHSMINEDFGLTPCEAITAGCIPLVHNSGGSIEVVPLRELRYNDWQEGVGRLRTMTQTDLHEQLTYLQRHVRANFSEETFQKRMIDILGVGR